MEDKDVFDWVGFIGGILSILGCIVEGIEKRIQAIEKPRKRRRRGKRRR